ncbi:MAG: DNA recombination protein RmuC [Elusimicrobiota bacterium]
MSPAMALAVLAAVLAGALLGALAVYAVVFSVRKNADAEARQRKEDLKGQFAAVSAEVFDKASEQFLKLAQSRLETEQVKASSELDQQRRAVETSVGQLQDRLKSYESLMREFESDRTRKYGSIEEQLRKATRTTEQLQTTTDRLYSVLSNSRTRGQWGERMAEDILRAAGLVENVQYVKNRAQDTVASRPDFTFRLPDGHKFNMDVKFPLDNYLRMVNAGSDEERARFKTDFLKDVKGRVKEITKRDYINPDERTLDYVLLFIPNEQIYGFVLESMPEILDEALAKKVVLTSPFSLYAVLAVIRQAFENFHFTKATEEVVRSIAAFRQAYEKFKERFVQLGERLDKASQTYAEITGPSYKKLDQAVARIEKIRAGDERAAVEEAEG